MWREVSRLPLGDTSVGKRKSKRGENIVAQKRSPIIHLRQAFQWLGKGKKGQESLGGGGKTQPRGKNQLGTPIRRCGFPGGGRR